MELQLDCKSDKAFLICGIKKGMSGTNDRTVGCGNCACRRSKKQSTIETSTFGSEMVALRVSYSSGLLLLMYN